MSQEKNIQKEIDRPDKPVVNEEEQNKPINPRDKDYDSEDKKQAFEENRNDSTTNEDGLPGQDDDSEKTIRETPRMASL